MANESWKHDQSLIIRDSGPGYLSGPITDPDGRAGRDEDTVW